MARSISYGVPTNRCGLQLRLGIEKGFFRAEGIDLDIRVVFGGPQIAAELDAGRLLIGELGTPPGLTAIANGARFKVVGSGVRRGAVQFLVARRGLARWKDLAGARLGVLSHGSCSDWYMRALLTHHGLDPDKDVALVPLGPRYPQIVPMLGERELDGAILSEPHVTIGEEAGYFNVWLGLNRCDVVPRMQWTIVVANDGTLVHEGNLVRGVLAGARRSYRYAAEHRDEWADFGARHFGVPRATMMRAIEREFDELHFDCQIDEDGMAAAMALQQRLGSVPLSLRLEDVLNRRFVPKETATGNTVASHPRPGYFVSS